ncbi:hypothetical protein EKH57_14295 [Halorubrum sp. BOL3-1]|uniref:hypothetical protein n=1 Tax=Halorubrum sp. BOL3-1 TaxID=2497325 RepID=UPI0010051291|nr:hypothetical protein [Halorubrum sp. BOL3-1]QAU13798.1 hypothetical protein EKH57_14295 [Halorubrum sp. BOL3-1]
MASVVRIVFVVRAVPVVRVAFAVRAILALLLGHRLSRLRDVRHVAFGGDEVVVVAYDDCDEDGDDEGPATDEEDDDPKRAETRIRPVDDAARADAALAFRLRGIDLRGVESDDAVSRTAVDAPETELVE